MRDFGRLLLGLVVVAVGSLYLLERADVLDAGATINRWWPSVIVAAGRFQLAERSHSALGPLVLVAAGTVLLLVTTNVAEGDVWSYVWPIAVVVAGCVAIARWAGAGTPRRGAGDEVVVALGVFGGLSVASA